MSFINSNEFKSTNIHGSFKNVDYPDSTILADGYFQRNLKVDGNLTVKNVILDESGILNNSGVAMKSYVDESINMLLGGQPSEFYDTLKEISDYIEADVSFGTVLTNSIATKANTSDVNTIINDIVNIDNELVTLYNKTDDLENNKLNDRISFSYRWSKLMSEADFGYFQDWNGYNSTNHYDLRMQLKQETVQNGEGTLIVDGHFDVLKTISSPTIDAINSTLSTKANTSDITTINSTLSTKANNSDITAINTTLSTKANTSDITTINNTLSTKANNYDIQTINNTLSNMAINSDITTINTALSTKVNLNNGFASNLQINDGMSVRNGGGTVPLSLSGQNFGAISTNYTNGQAEMDLFCSTTIQNPIYDAFNFYKMITETTSSLLFQIKNAGDVVCKGAISATNLTNVDNTSDSAKPISTAVQTALNNVLSIKANNSDITTINSTLSTKANNSDIQTINNTLSTKANNSDIQTINTTLSTKANNSDIQTINNTLSTKALNSDVAIINNTLSTKANNSDLTIINNKIKNIDLGTYTINDVIASSYNATLINGEYKAFEITVSKGYVQRIHFTSPISLSRSEVVPIAADGNAPAFNYAETLNNVSFTILKNNNGVVWRSGVCNSSDILPKTISLRNNAPGVNGFNPDTDLYFTNIDLSFIPDFDEIDSATYAIILNFSYGTNLFKSNLFVKVNTNETGFSCSPTNAVTVNNMSQISSNYKTRLFTTIPVLPISDNSQFSTSSIATNKITTHIADVDVLRVESDMYARKGIRYPFGANSDPNDTSNPIFITWKNNKLQFWVDDVLVHEL